MHLTDTEQRMLQGEEGDLVRQSMEILTTLGDIYGAERMLEIKNVHSPGVSYRVAGDAGLHYVREASIRGTFRVATTLNTVGIDTLDSSGLGFPQVFIERQMELLDAYRRMGARPTYTCTPYLVTEPPAFAEHVAWGESSAIAFVNSVIGARTNREGGPSALAAALAGRVPDYGLHRDAERFGSLHVVVEATLHTDTDFAAMGYHVGKLVGNRIPVFEGIGQKPSIDQFKALGAALATSGGVALFHILGHTPEALQNPHILLPQHDDLCVVDADLKAVRDRFTLQEPPDLIVIGCPHVSLDEMLKVARRLEGDRVHVDTWICTSRYIRDLAARRGWVRIIENAGVRIVCDTCPVLSPTSAKGYRCIATTSAKLAHYAPGLWNVETGLMDLEDCLVRAKLKPRG